MPLANSSIRTIFGSFHYSDSPTRRGIINIDPRWVKEHIVEVVAPILGKVKCHRVIAAQLKAALNEVDSLGMENLVDLQQWADGGGCFVPRHKGFNPARSLSAHSWGIAIDINHKSNSLGKTPTKDQAKLAKVFKRWGFEWGGEWSVPDGMHFEVVKLVVVTPEEEDGGSPCTIVGGGKTSLGRLRSGKSWGKVTEIVEIASAVSGVGMKAEWNPATSTISVKKV